MKKHQEMKTELINKMNEVSIELIENNYTGYICEAIMEFADSNVDIYTHELLEWLKENYDVVMEANEELGMPDDGDIIKQIQQGQFYKYECEMYEDLDNIIKLYALNHIMENNLLHLDIEPIFKDLEEINNNHTFEDIKDYIELYI